MNCFAGAAAGRHGEPARQGDVVPAIWHNILAHAPPKSWCNKIMTEQVRTMLFLIFTSLFLPLPPH